MSVCDRTGELHHRPAVEVMVAAMHSGKRNSPGPWSMPPAAPSDPEGAMRTPMATSNSPTDGHSARRKAGLDDLQVHNLRHTVGMRLRKAGVAEDTRADILWHSRQGMTAHYSQAHVHEVRAALELIMNEAGTQNRSLRSLAREARQQRAVPPVPSGSLRQKKNGLDACGI
jgi:hypothetical protein